MNTRFKYPKLSLFIASVIVVYLLFSGVLYAPLHSALALLGFFGTFLAGLLYPYSFTSAAGTAILLILSKDQNIVVAGIIAAFGALISDLAIFFFVRYSFSDEVNKLSKEPAVEAFNRLIPDLLRTYLRAIIANIFIASPLPTEIGVMMLTSDKKMSTKKFAVIVYILHASAIFVILLLGKTI